MALVPVHAITTYNDSTGTVTLILNLGIRRRCFISYTPQAALPHAKKPLAHLKGGWVGSKVGLAVLV